MKASEKTPLLLVEDDTSLAGSLADFLTQHGYDVDFAYNGASGIELARHNDYAVIVMDVSMPVMDGLTACKRLREDYAVDLPIIFLTARDTLDDKIAGYTSGGDDYLVKPFAPEELVCRLEALRKRRRFSGSQDVTAGKMKIYPTRCQVEYAGNKLELRGTTLKILTMLASSAPQVVSQEALAAELWSDGEPQSKPLRAYVYRLRQLLKDCFGHAFIETVYGKGYRFENPD